jgi:hypothetical protein
MSDIHAILVECVNARSQGREISDACARMIGAQFHDGQFSDTYKFVSTGAVTRPADLWHAFFGTRGESLMSDMLGTYLLAAGPRGPVTGWSDLWIQ